MNIKNMLRVADAIEKAEIPWLGFNMESFSSEGGHDRSGRDCGTTACLAGWATAFSLDIKGYKTLDKKDAETIGKRYFGLNETQVSQLFYPEGGGYAATHCEGARMLRYAALTGDCDWRNFFEEEGKLKLKKEAK